jgi:hypothetical protein
MSNANDMIHSCLYFNRDQQSHTKEASENALR